MKERQELIKKFIERRGEATLSELTQAFSGWSEMTIRRDLEFLEKSRFLIRTKGGARLLPMTYGVSEDVYGERENRNFRSKQDIGERAASLVEPDTGIFLDAGTTVMALARQLPDQNIAVVTAAPNIALEVAMKKQSPAVILLGGTLSRRSISMAGMTVLDQLRNLNIDTAFMSASGFSIGSGFSVGSQNECELKQAVIGKARRVVMLMDSSKADAMMPFTFARPEQIDIFITDPEIKPDLLDLFRAAGTEIILTDNSKVK